MAKPGNDRFMVVHQQLQLRYQQNSTGLHARVVVDKQTGVQYLYLGGKEGGPTVLIGQDGKPLLYEPEEGM